MSKLNQLEIGTVKAFRRYIELINAKGISNSKNHTEIENGDPTSLEHLLWMCVHCITKIRADGQGFSVDKYSRWLGYVQGCLISKKITTVEAERNITRLWFTKSETRKGDL